MRKKPFFKKKEKMGDDMIQSPTELINWSTGSLAESINLLLQRHRLKLMQGLSLTIDSHTLCVHERPMGREFHNNSTCGYCV